MRIVFRRVVILGSVLMLLVNSLSCGTILYPERIGQPRGGPLDVKVVALDTIGLLLFVVPGLIAFGVDIYNGTLFLPPGEYYGRADEPRRTHPDGTVEITVGREALAAENLEATLARVTGKAIPLDGADVKASYSSSIDETRAVIRAQSP